MLQSPGSFGFSGFGNPLGSYMNQQQLSDNVFSSRAKEEPRDDMYMGYIYTNSYRLCVVLWDLYFNGKCVQFDDWRGIWAGYAFNWTPYQSKMGAGLFGGALALLEDELIKADIR
ncbi:WRKY transcription factor [Spatholobus suberectus]|nr:WRKY transcription factor [Spatholobus suberectus]